MFASGDFNVVYLLFCVACGLAFGGWFMRKAKEGDAAREAERKEREASAGQ